MENKNVKKTEDKSIQKTSGYVFTPKVDIWETEDDIHLIAEMPGVDEKNVDINLEDQTLTILGRVMPDEMEGYEKVYSEYHVGNYERSFTVAQDIDRDKIKATMKQGVLTLVVPKSESAKPKRIEVKAE
ncbi:MAG: Hsp20/alpha crystallin family protein [Candidatus Aureabacteria bacterium]|nr:Hsp20/alpha crystallin family protein [Candidatus Auribacterota bacterium]